MNRTIHNCNVCILQIWATTETDMPISSTALNQSKLLNYFHCRFLKEKWRQKFFIVSFERDSKTIYKSLLQNF